MGPGAIAVIVVLVIVVLVLVGFVSVQWIGPSTIHRVWVDTCRAAKSYLYGMGAQHAAWTNTHVGDDCPSCRSTVSGGPVPTDTTSEARAARAAIGSALSGEGDDEQTGGLYMDSLGRSVRSAASAPAPVQRMATVDGDRGADGSLDRFNFQQSHVAQYWKNPAQQLMSSMPSEEEQKLIGSTVPYTRKVVGDYLRGRSIRVEPRPELDDADYYARSIGDYLTPDNSPYGFGKLENDPNWAKKLEAIKAKSIRQGSIFAVMNAGIDTPAMAGVIDQIRSHETFPGGPGHPPMVDARAS